MKRSSLILILIITLININSCRNGNNSISEHKNVDSLLIDFIKQTVISDTILNKFCLIQESSLPSLSIGGSWLAQRDTNFWHHFGDTLTITKKDSIEIVSQTHDSSFNWSDKKLSLKLTSSKLIEDYQSKLFKDTTEKGFESSKKEFEVLFGKGFISISKPIFFRKGEFALMNYMYLNYYNFCCGFGQLNLYKRENGKWRKFKTITASYS